MRKHFKRCTSAVIATLIFSYHLAVGEDLGTKTIFKDGNLIRVPVEPTPERHDSIYLNLEEEQRSLQGINERRRAEGLPPMVLQGPRQGAPTTVEKFDLPDNQKIPSCIYAAGSSFPDYCFNFDQGTKPIFEAGKDPQSVLDEIKAKHGIVGKYNVVPKGYSARPVDDDAEDVKNGLIAPVSPDDAISKNAGLDGNGNE